MVDIDVKHPSAHYTRDDLVAILSEFNRTIDDIHIDINCIKEWIRSQPHLTHIPAERTVAEFIDERIILSLLICNKFAIEKTKVNIDYYYSIRGMLPKVFANRLPTSKDNQLIRKMLRTLTLPKLFNRRRVIMIVADEMEHKCDGFTLLSKLFMDYEALIYRDFSVSKELVWDFTKSNVAFWTICTPVIAKILATVPEKVYRSRAHMIRIIGLPTFAQVAVNLILSNVSPNLRKRVSMHSKRTEMVNFYPKEQLPFEFGGAGPSYRDLSAQFDDMVDQCEEYFREMQYVRVDSNLRPAKMDDDDLLGFYGHFRQLNTD